MKIALSEAVARVREAVSLPEDTYWELQWKIMEEEAPA